jgi:hypothetical protein
MLAHQKYRRVDGSGRVGQSLPGYPFKMRNRVISANALANESILETDQTARLHQPIFPFPSLHAGQLEEGKESNFLIKEDWQVQS